MESFNPFLPYDSTDSHDILSKIQVSIAVISKANSLLSYKADETSSDIISNTGISQFTLGYTLYSGLEHQGIFDVPRFY